MLTDVDIMLRVQAGETSLFEELVRRYREKLLKFATSKLGNRDHAEDIVQDAFLAAFHHRNSYDSSFAFSTWIWTITLNLTRSTIRQSIREHQLQQIYWESREAQTGNPQRLLPLELLLKSEEQSQVHDWLLLIPEPQADAIRLRFLGGLSFEQISLTMHCSLSGAKRRVKLGLEKLLEHARTVTPEKPTDPGQ